MQAILTPLGEEPIQMSISHLPDSVHPQKANLVNLGLFFLSCGNFQSVAAITLLIQRRGWTHA
jgi:hypothetical protein